MGRVARPDGLVLLQDVDWGLSVSWPPMPRTQAWIDALERLEALNQPELYSNRHFGRRLGRPGK